MQDFGSISTWSVNEPPPATAVRQAVIDELADRIVSIRPSRPTMRASFDDFKKPWRDAVEKGYDRKSGEGFYRNAPDFRSARELLLGPAGPAGSGHVVLCAHDPLTGEDHRAVSIEAPENAVLIVDSVFAMRPEYDDFWDYRIWVDVPIDAALERGIRRDTAMEGAAGAEHQHRNRYRVALEIYMREVDPLSRADVVVDNSDFDNPAIIDG